VTKALRFDDRVALVTGAGRGIGRAHALLLASRGAKVVVNDLGVANADGTGEASKRPADEVAAEIVAAGGAAVANFEDVSTEAGGGHAVQQAMDGFGRLDIVINNAGIVGGGTFDGLTIEGLQKHLRHHCYTSFHVTKRAWPILKKQKFGRVVFTTSGVGLYGMPASTPYGIAKGAVYGMVRALGLEGPESGINVNGIAPAAFTRMVAGLEPSLREAFQQQVRPDQIAPTAAWLAHESCDLSGQVFEVGGGRIAKVVVAETRGYFNPDHTPEDVAANVDAICDEEDYLVFKSGGEVAEHIVKLALS
jgi:NAD(P)-dependent dehydrogenase (short-subunit alcohol dehydrogenase family)